MWNGYLDIFINYFILLFYFIIERAIFLWNCKEFENQSQHK
jgi:hypothetical protein